MDLDKIINELRIERESLNEAIIALERLLPPSLREAANDPPVKRRGRPAAQPVPEPE